MTSIDVPDLLGFHLLGLDLEIKGPGTQSSRLSSPVSGARLLIGRRWADAHHSGMDVEAGIDFHDRSTGLVAVRESKPDRPDAYWERIHYGFLGVKEVRARSLVPRIPLRRIAISRRKAQRAANEILAAWRDMAAPLLGRTVMVPDRIDVELRGYDAETGKPNARPEIPAGIAPAAVAKPLRLTPERLFVRDDGNGFEVWVRVPVAEHGWDNGGEEHGWFDCQFSVGQVHRLSDLTAMAARLACAA